MRVVAVLAVLCMCSCYLIAQFSIFLREAALLSSITRIRDHVKANEASLIVNSSSTHSRSLSKAIHSSADVQFG